MVDLVVMNLLEQFHQPPVPVKPRLNPFKFCWYDSAYVIKTGNNTTDGLGGWWDTAEKERPFCNTFNVHHVH
jgi:hypothetical protein